MTSVLPAKVSLREADPWHEYQAMAHLRVDALVNHCCSGSYNHCCMKENGNSQCEIKCCDHKLRKEGRKTELH